MIAKNNNFGMYQRVALIISSIIPFFIWGPFFPDLIVSVSSLVFLFLIIKEHNFRFLTVKPLILFFSFCVCCILSSMLSENILFSLKSSLFYFRIGLFSCVIWYLIENDKSLLRYFYYVLIICFSFLVIDGYTQFFLGENIFGMKISNPYNRISSLFGDELIMGSYLSRLFPLLFALFIIKKKNKYEIYFIGILFILVDILIFISGERTAFFFLNLSTIFIIIFIKEYQKFRIFTFIVAFFFIGAITLGGNSEYKNRMVFEPLKSMGIFAETDKKYFFTLHHHNLFKVGLNMFYDKPLLGHGPKMFRVKCSDDKYDEGVHSCDTHPHNFYVQLLSETGILGFSFLFTAFCYVIYCSFKQFKSIIFKEKRFLTDYQVCLLAGILITVWPLSPNGNFFNNWLSIIYSLPIGFYLHSIYGINKNKVLNVVS